MMVLDELYNLTLQVIEKFEQADQQKREDMVTTLELFVSKREKLLKKVSSPYSNEEYNIGKELVKLDHQLNKLVDDYSNEFKVDLANLSKKRKSNKKYVNPYINVYGTDGNFIDKRN